MAFCCRGCALILVLNALGFAGFYLASVPVASNNQTTAFFFALVVLGASVLSLGQGATRDDHFDLLARAGRWLLPSMYFFGIYHKINTDFLDPAVSCAVVLYEALFEGSWFAGWSFGQYGAIYATFVIEAIAMVALFIPRLKVFGMAIGIPFHLIIGFTGYAYYKDFSTIVLVLYALFIPREAYQTAFSAVARRLGSPGTALMVGRWALWAFAGAYAVFALMRPGLGLIPTDVFMMPFFAIYGGAFYLFAVTCTGRNAGQSFKGGAVLLILPLLYFANGWSPYLGLKTESSIAMYSNLHTEGGETNHLLHGVLPGTWDYQSDLVVPLGSNSSGFDAAFVGPGKALVRYHLDAMLAATPGLVVLVEGPDGPVSTAEGWQNSYLATPALLRAFLIFKPVDFTRPKVCTH